MADNWLEGHSSKDTNTRVDELLWHIHVSSEQFMNNPNIAAIIRYLSLMRRLLIEVEPAIYRHKKNKKSRLTIKSSKEGIKKAEKLIRLAELPPEVKVEVGIKRSSKDLLFEAHQILYEKEEDIRLALQTIGFFFRPSGRNIPGIDSLSRSKGSEENA